MKGHRTRIAMVLALVGLAACEEPADLTLPTVDQAEAYYTYDRDFTAEINGNVVTLTFSQSADQLRRGGSLWAKVGPYIFLFTEETYQMIQDYPGIAGVRVVTKAGNAEVANVLLARETLSDVLWRRSLNIAGQARRDGSERMTLLTDLVRWGERHTEYEYSPRYVR